MPISHSSIPYEQLSATLNRRLINNALKDDASLDLTFIGQHRARQALEFGLGMQASGYNMYVMGEQATGRYTLVHDYIAKHVQSMPTPDDWCFVNNFEDEREPFVLRLPPGEIKALSKNIEALLDDLQDTFPAAFDNPGYQRKKAAINRGFDQLYDNVIAEIEQFAQSKNVALYEDDGSISFAPIVNGKPLEDTEFAHLPDEQRQHYYTLIDQLEDHLSEQLIELPKWKRECSEQLRQLKKDTAEQGIRPLLKQLEHQYASDLGILKFLRQLKPHLVETVVEILAEESKDDKQDDYDKRGILDEQYLPNILRSQPINGGAPVVYEPNPTYQNLFGRVEYSNVQGSVFTNYRMIRAGALHRANGGYLLLDADKMVEQPYVWEALKLALKREELKMDNPQQEVGMVNSVTLNPQVIPLQVKVVLMGSRDLYYLFQDYDDEYHELFRVLVDFDHEIPIEKDNLVAFIGKVRHQVQNLGLEGITPKAVHRVLEYSLRLAEHQTRMSARFADVIELLLEAHFFCRQKNSEQLDCIHIEMALEAKEKRNNRVSQSVLDEIKQGQVLIATEGLEVGKVNGITVLEVGNSVFGTPARISSTVYPGSSGVVDIEREVELGQPIHSKGVMLLTGYLGHKYAHGFSLTLSANIALEQSYGHVDGDSASLGELIALISALTSVPIKQSLAITGSINQYGEVQAIGGVNEKIEGFFKLCQYRGLTGEQGVIIPKSNQTNLMLNNEVIQAVKEQKFHIYGVEVVDDALAILTGKDAGKLNSKGDYPKRSVNGLAVKYLQYLSDIVNGHQDD